MEIKKEEIEKFQEILKSKSDEEVIEMYQNIKSYEKEIKDLIIEEFGNRNLKIEEKIEEEVKKKRSMLRVFLFIVGICGFIGMIIGSKFSGFILTMIVFSIYYVVRRIKEDKKTFFKNVIILIIVIAVLGMIKDILKTKKNNENESKNKVETSETISYEKANKEEIEKENKKQIEREKYLKEKYDTKEMKEARKRIEKLTAELNQNNNNPELYIERGKANKIIYKNYEAIEDYSSAINLNPNNSKYYMLRAELSEDNEEIERDIKTVLELEKNDEIYGQIGEIYFRKKMYEHAIKYYEKALSVNKSKKEIMEDLISCYIETDKTEKGLELSDIYIKKFPKDYNGYVYKALIYEKNEENSKALFYYEQGLNRFKTEAELYNRIGVVKANLGDYKSAIKYLRRAENMWSKEKWVNAASFSDEAEVLKNLEKIPEAIEAYKNVIKVIKNNEETDKDKNNTRIEYNKIAELYEQLGNNEKSNEYYEKANEIEEYRKKILGIY